MQISAQLELISLVRWLIVFSTVWPGKRRIWNQNTTKNRVMNGFWEKKSRNSCLSCFLADVISVSQVYFVGTENATFRANFDEGSFLWNVQIPLQILWMFWTQYISLMTLRWNNCCKQNFSQTEKYTFPSDFSVK